MTAELHEDPDILLQWIRKNVNFNGGSRKYMGILVMEIIIIIYYVLHN
jgi:hypothetical protein